MNAGLWCWCGLWSIYLQRVGHLVIEKYCAYGFVCHSLSAWTVFSNVAISMFIMSCSVTGYLSRFSFTFTQMICMLVRCRLTALISHNRYNFYSPCIFLFSRLLFLHFLYLWMAAVLSNPTSMVLSTCPFLCYPLLVATWGYPKVILCGGCFFWSYVCWCSSVLDVFWDEDASDYTRSPHHQPVTAL